MRAPTPLTSADPRSAGRFHLLGRLASGGMGEVYLGRRDDRPDSLVVVKLLRADLAHDPLFRERFAAEVAASRHLARLTGTSVARVVDADVHADRPWLAAEYVPGPTVADAARPGGLPAAEVAAIAGSLAAALASMHANGLVHGDVTPSNVVLGPDGVRLIDLGLVRTVDEPAAPGVRLGSPGWCAPEVAAGALPQPSSDVHGWGCTVAYAASGGSPFGEGTAQERERRMLSAAPALDTVPERLRVPVAAALDPDPASRPGASTLLSWVTVEPSLPIAAGPPVQPPVAVATEPLLSSADALATLVRAPLVTTRPVVAPTRIELAPSVPAAPEQGARRGRRALGAAAAAAAVIGAVLMWGGTWGDVARGSDSHGAVTVTPSPSSSLQHATARPASPAPSATTASVRTAPPVRAGGKDSGKGKGHGHKH